MIYAAPVVGGPLDGQKLARTEQWYDALLPDEPTVFVKNRGDGARLVPARIAYEFVPIYMDSNNEINVWKPVGQTRLVTLKKLLQGYKP